MADNKDLPDVLGMTADIIAAYVSHNKVDASEVSKIIVDINGALVAANRPIDEAMPVSITLPNPYQIRRSITEDALISFEDGKRYKSMKRSLTRRGMTPDEYREKWGLPRDYPMVAPAYAAARSALAKSMGLGKKGRKFVSKAASSRGRVRKSEA